MEKFDEIMANIQKELLELKEINQSLREENIFLRKQLGMSTNNDNEDLSLNEAFDNFSLIDDHDGKKYRAYITCLNNGYSKISDFRNKSIYDIIKIQEVGAITCAILIAFLEHYDIYIELPDLEFVHGIDGYRTIKRTYEALPKVRKRIVFKE